MLVLGLAILFGLATAGCDAFRGDAPAFVEGTYTLPDGTRAAFRTDAIARASAYSGLGTSDVFYFGSQNDGEPCPPGDVCVLIRFTQNGLHPQAGEFLTEIGPPSPPRISVTATLRPVEGVAPSVPTSDPRVATLYYPPGTVVVRVVDGRVEGEFDVEGPPNTAPGDDRPERIRLEGRFSVPYEPYRP